MTTKTDFNATCDELLDHAAAARKSLEEKRAASKAKAQAAIDKYPLL